MLIDPLSNGCWRDAKRCHDGRISCNTDCHLNLPKRHSISIIDLVQIKKETDMLRFVSRTSKWFLIPALAFATGACDVGGDEDREIGNDDKNPDVEDARIVGGDDADIVNFPWQISMQSNTGSHFCGGSVLNQDWILSAAHCVDGTSPTSIRIAAGFTKQNESNNGQVRQVAEIISYPGYVSPEFGKDVALLRLSSPLDLSDANVAAIEIVTPADEAAGLVNANVLSTVTGWGTLSPGGSLPNTLQKVDVPLVTNADANAAYPNTDITDDQLAAGIIGIGGVDACQGDSGGPLVVPNANRDGFLLAGVVSWGISCADRRYPGLYARVASFASWIQENVGTATPDDPQDPPTPPSTDVVINETGLTGGKGDWLDYTVEVPAGTSSLETLMSGGIGDADLYVQFQNWPTRNSYDCRSYRSTNDEACTIDNPQPGVWYVSIRGYRNFSGANLTARLNP